jgi:predicted nucleic acid-binding Zn ribbon protein
MLEPLKQTLDKWERRHVSQSYRQFQFILNLWADIVGPQVAAHTKPVSLQDQVLRVLTTNSTWSQHLMFERQRIAVKLNAQLSVNLKDIRFQPGLLPNSANPMRDRSLPPTQADLRSHPSWVEPPPKTKPAQPVSNPQEAFERWSEHIENRARSLQPCPVCQCPTPPGEIQRWDMCSFCVAKQWQTSPS